VLARGVTDRAKLGKQVGVKGEVVGLGVRVAPATQEEGERGGRVLYMASTPSIRPLKDFTMVAAARRQPPLLSLLLH